MKFKEWKQLNESKKSSKDFLGESAPYADTADEGFPVACGDVIETKSCQGSGTIEAIVESDQGALVRYRDEDGTLWETELDNVVLVEAKSGKVSFTEEFDMSEQEAKDLQKQYKISISKQKGGYRKQEWKISGSRANIVKFIENETGGDVEDYLEESEQLNEGVVDSIAREQKAKELKLPSDKKKWTPAQWVEVWDGVEFSDALNELSSMFKMKGMMEGQTEIVLRKGNNSSVRISTGPNYDTHIQMRLYNKTMTRQQLKILQDALQKLDLF